MNLFSKSPIVGIINSRKKAHVHRMMFLVFLSFLGSRGYSQEFAPLGTKWTYEEFGPRGFGFNIATQFRVEKDTLINKRYCPIITRYTLNEYGIWERWASEIVSSSADGDRVYVFLQDSFHLLFDFTAEVGDTIEVVDEKFNFLFADPGVNYTQHRFSYKIDSISLISIGMDTLLTQFVSYTWPTFDIVPEMGFQDVLDYTNNIPGRIVKGVGALSRAGPLGTSSDLSYFFDYYPDYLTCYEDPNRFYSFRAIDCDSLISFYTSTDDLSPRSGDHVKVYPNPFSNFIVIDHQGERVNYIRIFDFYGSSIRAIEPISSKTVIDLSNISAGIYLVSLSFSGGEMINYRIVKN